MSGLFFHEIGIYPKGYGETTYLPMGLVINLVSMQCFGSPASMAPKAMKKNLAQRESKSYENPCQKEKPLSKGKALVKRKTRRIQQRQTSCQKRPKKPQTEKRQPSQIGEAHSG